MNTVVAANSTRNVSYTCRSEKQVRLIWVVNGTQIWSDEQRKDFAAIGIWMETVTPDHDLHLVMTPDGREAQERVSIMCIAYTNEEGRIGSGETSPTHWIIFFGIPFQTMVLQILYLLFPYRYPWRCRRFGAGLLFRISAKAPVVQT